MHPRHPVSDDLLRIADFQEGTLTLHQCLDHGLSKHSISRLLRTGWHRFAPGIYFTRPHEPTFRALAWAATAYAGPGASVGLHGAAYLHGWIRTPPVRLDVWVPRERALRPWPRVSFHRDSLGREWCAGPPHTDWAATALDLCSGSSIDGVVTWLARAGGAGTRAQHLMRELARRPAQPQRALIAEMLGQVAVGAESPLEVRFMRDVLAAHELPLGSRQVQTRTGRIDVVDEVHAVAYELDGLLGHAGTGAFRDAHRDNANAATGLVTLRYGWTDVAGDPCCLVPQIASVLRTRGWSDRPARCRNCPDRPGGERSPRTRGPGSPSDRSGPGTTRPRPPPAR